ncbi:MAG: PfkB family carbohydrate kinase [Haloarculaceae archaeon]
MSRVVCAGHVNWDVTLFVDRLPGADEEAVVADRRAGGGGSASNVATGLEGLEIDASLLGSVGVDDAGSRATEELAAAGVDTTHVGAVDSGPTTVKHLLVDEAGEIAVLARAGVNEAYSAGDLPEHALVAADHLHLTSQPPATAARLAERAAGAGLAVSFDPGRRLADREYTDVVDAVDLVFLNDVEAGAAAASGLFDSGPTDLAVVETRGAGGAAFRQDDRRLAHPGFDVESVDTTGAGDAFAAGYLAARLDGAGPERSLAVGNACGALASTRVGARAALTWEGVEDLLDGDGT